MDHCKNLHELLRWGTWRLRRIVDDGGFAESARRKRCGRLYAQRVDPRGLEEQLKSHTSSAGLRGPIEITHPKGARVLGLRRARFLDSSEALQRSPTSGTGPAGPSTCERTGSCLLFSPRGLAEFRTRYPDIQLSD